MMGEGKNMCGCPHHKAGGVLVILFGLVFLLGAYEWVTPGTVSVAWPILVIIGGIGMLCGGSCKCCKSGDGCGCSTGK